jgi:hypothetical protein
LPAELLDSAFRPREALRSSDFAGGQSSQPNERRKLRRKGLRRAQSSRCPRPRIRPLGAMEVWSTGVLRMSELDPGSAGLVLLSGRGCPSLLRVSEFEDSDSTELVALLPGEASESIGCRFQRLANVFAPGIHCSRRSRRFF